MKLLCVIDSLASGGAQRQMVSLACGLKARGHDVEILVYFPQYRFFRPDIDGAGVVVHEVDKGPGISLSVVRKLRELMQRQSYAAVISFLDAPNLYCELAKLLCLSSTLLIVSERCSRLADKGRFRPRLLRLMHCVAGFVVSNSFSHANWLRERVGLRKKTRVVYNGYSLPPLSEERRLRAVGSDLHFLVVGRIHPQKNGVRLIEALSLYFSRHGKVPLIAWAGRQETDPASLALRKEMDDRLTKHPEVAVRWRWLGERSDVHTLMLDVDAILHVSLYEGLPNVVCEAFLAGRPVIASDVCDHRLLVEDGVRGVLCDPLSPDSICDAFERFDAMSDSERALLGQNARKYAEEHLTVDRMVGEYEALLSDFKTLRPNG
jgi:glycosyltransferase involved in cell wall biosynthesis